MLEKHPQLAQALKNNLQMLQTSASTPAQVLVVQTDALVWLNKATASAWADVVFLDPPFRSDLLKTSLPLVMLQLTADGVIYIEWHESLTDSRNTDNAQWLSGLGLEVFRQDKAGQVHYHLLRRSKQLHPFENASTSGKGTKESS